MRAPDRERLLLREALKQAQAAEIAARAAAKATAELCNETHTREGAGVDRNAACAASDRCAQLKGKAAAAASFLETLAKTHDLLTAPQAGLFDPQRGATP